MGHEKKNGTKRRHKFKGTSARARAVDVDVTHKLHAEGFLDPDAVLSEAEEEGWFGYESAGGEEAQAASLRACFFRDELERSRLDTDAAMNRLYHRARPLCQTLPQLLHHSPKIVALLLDVIRNPSACGSKYALQLLSVLMRDLQSAAHSFLADVMSALTGVMVDSVEPELSGLAFKAMGYFFKFDAAQIRADLDALRPFYGLILGHPRQFVRRFGAEALAPLLRGSDPKVLRKHLKGLISATAAACEEEVLRRDAMLDGVSMLLFYTCKGVRGRLHSRGSAVIRLTLGTVSGPQESTKKMVPLMKVSAYREWSAKIAESMLVHLCSHLRSPHSDPFWMELHYSVGVALECLRSTEDGKGASRSSQLTVAHILTSLMVAAVRHGRGVLLRDGSVSNKHVPLLLETVSLGLKVLHGLLPSKHLSSAATQLWLEFGDLLVSCWAALYKDDSHQFGSRIRFLLSMYLGLPADAPTSSPAVDTSLPISLAYRAPVKLCELLFCGDGPPSAAVESYAIPILMAFCCSPSLDRATALEVVLRIVSGTGSWVHSSLSEKTTGNMSASSHHLASLASLSLESVNDAVPSAGEAADLANTSVACVALHCLPQLILGNDRRKKDWVRTRCVPSLLQAGFQWISGRCSSCSSLVLAGKAFEAVAALLMNNETFSGDFLDSAARKLRIYVRQGLQAKPRSISLLRSACWAFACSGSREGDPMDEDIFSLLCSNAQSQVKLVRLYSARLATLLCNSSDSAPLKLCMELEEIVVSVSTERDLTSRLSSLEVMARCGQLSPRAASFVANYCLGVLSVKFSSAWPAAHSVFSSIASSRATEAAAWEALVTKMREVELGHTDVVGEYCNESNMSSMDVDDSESAQRLPYALTNTAIALEAMGSSGRCKLLEDPPLFKESGVDMVFLASMGVMHDPSVESSLSGEDGIVPLLSYTDVEQLHALTWGALKSAPELFRKHGRVVVPDVLGFIVAWYGLYFPDDPLSHVVQSQLQEKENEKIAGRVDEIFAHARAKEVRAPTSASSVRTRLFTMLSCIVECGPRGLTGAQVLKYVFLEFLARPDPASAKLALNGLLAFKSPTLTLYKDNLTALSDEGTLREELTRFRETFDSSSEGATIEAEHRKELVPIVVRLLFGRLLSRGIRGRIASRWPPKARRAAVLSFLAGLQPDELGYLVALMLRSFKPSVVLLNAISGDSVFTELLQLSADDMKCVGLSKKTGFLKLAMDAVKQLGVRLLPYVDAMSHVLLLLLDETAGDTMGRQMPNGGEAGLEQDEIGGSDEEGSAIADIESSTTLRTLCLHTWAEFMVAFSSDHDFVALGARFWRPLLVPLENLPGSCVGASNPPALLALIRKMAEHPVHLAGLLAVGDGGLSQSTQPLVAALRCMDVGGGSPTVVDCCLSIMEVLVAHNGGQLILPHVGLIIEIFSKRLGIGKDDREHGDDGEKLLGKGTISRELAVLQSIAELLRDCDDSTSLPVSAAENLGGALLRCLSRQQRELRKSRLEDIDEGPILSVMLAYAALVPRMGDGRRAWGHLSRLLGTHGSKMGFGLPFPRNALVAALSVAAERPDLAQAGAGRSMLVLKDLNAHDPESLEDIDFDRVVPAFNQLTDGAGWMEIVAATETPSSLGSQPFGGLALGAVAHHCLFMLHTTEVAVRGAASAALCRLARVVGAEMKQPGDAWYSVLQAVLLPGLRNGMGSPDQGARKCYMSVLGAVVQWVSDTQGAAVPTDLSLLSRPDDPEGDFFSNVTHMQLHRRARGMLTMRKHASDFSPATITHYLIPLALHPLHESLVSKAKPGEHTLLTEATAALAGLAAVLPWSHYTRCVRELMIQVKHSPGDRDRPLANALCAVLDEWHFEVVKPPTREDVEQVSQGSELVEIESDSGQDGDRAAERGAVWQILTSRLIPGLKGFMTVQKAASDGAGSKENVVRANVAIALVKLLRLLPFEDLEAQLGPVILSVCQTLRSRDSSVRDAARLALGRMVASLGPGHAGTVFDVLQTCLPSDGYQLHVRTYTLATVIRTIEEGGYAPPEAMSLDAFKGEITSDEANNVLLNRPAFDVALPAAVSMLCDDLFGVGAEARRAAAGGHEVSHVSKTKEAKGAKALECIEAMARMALFRPTHSLACPDDPMTASSAHALTTPFLLRLSGCDSRAVITKANEVLRRLAVGFSINKSAIAAEIFPYIHATCAPFLLIPHDDDDDEESSDGEPEEDSDSDVEDRGAAVTDAGWNATESARATKGAHPSLSERKLARVKLSVGANTPRLTGADKYTSKRRRIGDTSDGPLNLLSDPASVGAVMFGLTLITAYLKRRGKKEKESSALVDPFIPLLSGCIGGHSQDNITVMALKTLRMLINREWSDVALLPSLDQHAHTLCRKVTRLLLKSGAIGTDSEVPQACIKTLSSLLQMQVDRGEAVNSSRPMGLPRKQLRAVLVMLQQAGLDADHAAPWLSLAKTVVTARVLLPEVYDLMFKFVGLAVTGGRAATRTACATVLFTFIETYPMGKKRQVRHIKAVLEGISYEHDEGRMAAITMVDRLARHLPTPVLDEHAPLIYLTLCERLGSDSSPACRSAVADALRALVSRVSANLLHSLLDYALKWAATEENHEEGDGLFATGMQALGIAAVARPDLVRRGGRVEAALREVSKSVPYDLSSASNQNWERVYVAVMCLEKYMTALPGVCDRVLMTSNEPGLARLLDSLSASLLFPHAWVRLACCRVWGLFLSRRDPVSLSPFKGGGGVPKEEEYLVRSGALFRLAKNHAAQLDRNGVEPGLADQAVSNLVWIGRSLLHHRFQKGEEKAGASVDDADDDSGEGNHSDSLGWLFRRMSFMSRAKGEARRRAAFVWFSTMAERVLDEETTRAFLPHMLTPLRRCILDAAAGDAGADVHRDGGEGLSSAADIAEATMEVLERKAGSSAYLDAVTRVNMALEGKRERRKSEAKILAVTDPGAAAQVKAARLQQKKLQRKRKLERTKIEKEGFKKRRSSTKK